MRLLIRSVIVGALCTSSSGCADFTTFKQRAALDESSYSLDAKQRVVLSFERANGLGRTTRYVCAEPSPDALSALAASGALEAQVAGQGGGAASASLNEAVASIGLRTQTIQLLRDGLYRACEAYLNGAIDEFGYALLLNKYDETMISLLALEGLSSMRPAAQVAIGGEATGKSSGKQDTTIPGNATQSSDGAEADDAAATAATVVIEDSAESSAKVTTVQFSPPAAPNMDAASLAVVSPQITKLVRQVTQGSAVVGACMMWLARQTDDDLKTDQAQKLMEYCQWRRDALDFLATPEGACLAWLASGEGTEDKVRGSFCADVLRTSGAFAQAGATTDLRVAAK